MNHDILSVFDSPSINISQKTRTNYKNKLMFLSKNCGNEPVKAIIFSWDPTNVLDRIHESTEETKLVCVSSILAYLKHNNMKCKHAKVYDAWLKAYNYLENEKRLRIKSNKPTPRQGQGLLDWQNNVIAVRDSLPYAEKEHLLLCVYSYIPPRRQQDYAELLIDVDQNDCNFLSLKEGFCCFRNYKTAKSMGEARIQMPPELIKVIKESVKRYPRKYLFQKRDGQPYGDSFQKFCNLTLKKIFMNNPYVSVNSLRHSFASYLNSNRTLTLQQREDYAHQMGHSLIKNMEYVFL